MRSSEFLKNEHGIILVTSLMFVAILTILGATGYMITSSDLMISKNYRIAKEAHYVAEAGCEEARRRMGAVTQAGTPTKEWRGFIGSAAATASIFGYDSGNSDHQAPASSLQSDLDYTVMIRHKTETDISTDLNSDGDMNDILRWGDPDGDYDHELNLTTGKPIEVVTCQGTAKSSVKKITIEIRNESLFFDPPAALYVNGNLDKNGVSGGAYGAYNYPTCAKKPDIVTTTNAGACPPPPSKNCEANDWPAGGSSPKWLVNDVTDIYPISQVIAQLAGAATQTISSGTNQTFGSVSNKTGIYYSNGNWSGNNLDGYGILVINGDVTLGGNISWHGIVIISGVATFGGGGNQSIYGAVIANAATTIGGNPDVYYDCEVINDLDEANARYYASMWKDYQ
ncbi:MAG: pilus assembly PilX N-terminal domain-containing protein [Desulfobacterales bacterium]|nr:pilus assembly PilX N-terminal domain-containing protein [Desulfobacterales bacterium]